MFQKDMTASEKECIACGPSATTAQAVISGFAIGLEVGRLPPDEQKDGICDVLCLAHLRMFTEAARLIALTGTGRAHG